MASLLAGLDDHRLSVAIHRATSDIHPTPRRQIAKDLISQIQSGLGIEHRHPTSIAQQLNSTRTPPTPAGGHLPPHVRRGRAPGAKRGQPHFGPKRRAAGASIVAASVGLRTRASREPAI